jgi:hypothetical protein
LNPILDQGRASRYALVYITSSEETLTQKASMIALTRTVTGAG